MGKWGVGVLFALAAATLHSEPLYQGLPQRLPASFLEQGRFVPYESIEKRTDLFVHEILSVQPAHVSPEQIFTDDHWAALPSGKRILVLNNGEWVFPAGTRIIHRIFVRTHPPVLMEVRLIEKRAGTGWAFGIYHPTVLGNFSLVRNWETDVQLTAPIDKIGNVRINYNGIHPASCQVCHLNHSAQPKQNRPIEEAGPCGFVPENPHMNEWARRYAEQNGVWPF